MMTGESAVHLLHGMLRIPSPSGYEAELADYVVGAMRRLGYTAHVDQAGNAVGEIVRGPGPTVMLVGHLDTVPGDLPVRVDGDRLYGRGAVDAKGPLAAMIRAAAGAEFHGTLVVVGAVGEETSMSPGARHLRATRPQPDMLIVGEPSGWDSVVLGYKGKLDLRFRVERAATHDTNPAPKAAELAASAWSLLLEILGPDVGHDGFDTPGPTLVSIRGDGVSAEADFSIRLPPGFDVPSLVTTLRACLPDGTLQLVNSVPACRVDRRNPVVRALVVGIRAQDGRPRMKVKTGTSDMNTLTEVWRVPAATYGPGDGRLCHAGDEHILVPDYLRSIDVLTRALHELGCHPAHRPSPLAEAAPHGGVSW
ncbi:M20/M25/M40 family metallo-hydrolase [Streptosporangium sp. CA-115845]|uniref:M20/M25/M40 family metallo-hydrolase n=1 Tax=Streptosporangium sp. CA-115845 TaxID=3240071 RepID=UPI003D8EFB45